MKWPLTGLAGLCGSGSILQGQDVLLELPLCLSFLSPFQAGPLLASQSSPPLLFPTGGASTQLFLGPGQRAVRVGGGSQAGDRGQGPTGTRWGTHSPPPETLGVLRPREAGDRVAE